MITKEHHIAYFCPSESWGGLEMNQVRNGLWMKNRGHKVVVLTQKESKTHRAAEKCGLPVEFIQHHKKYYDVVNANQLRKTINKLQITHLIVRNPKDMSVTALAKTMLKNRLFLAYFMEMQLGIPKKDIIHTIRFNQFDLWSCPLPWLKKQVISHSKFPPKKIKVIPSGLELSVFLPSMSQEKAKEVMQLPTHKKYIGLAGRFDPQKGQLLLLKAFNKIKEEVTHDIVLLGETTHGEHEKYLDELNAFIKKNNIQNRVHFRPFRKDIAPFYKAIDVFTMATEKETFGMVTIEAMASGCKIVGSNSGGTIEILQHGELGFLFEPLNADDLSKKLITVTKLKDFDKNKLIKAAKRYDAYEICKRVEKSLLIQK